MLHTVLHELELGLLAVYSQSICPCANFLDTHPPSPSIPTATISIS